MKTFLRTRAGFGLVHLPGDASVEGPSEGSGAVRKPVALVLIGCALILFLLTVSSTQADTVIVKDLVYVDSETGGKISAYDEGTLNLRWTTDLSSLVIDGSLFVSADKDFIYVGMDTESGGSLAVLSASTGEVSWIKFFTVAVSSAPVVTKDYLYVGTQTVVRALDRINGTDLWSTDVLGPVDSSPAVEKGVVYVSTSVSAIDTLWALNADTGAILNTAPLN